MDRTGEQADQFELTSQANQRVVLSDFSGNWVWMVFHRHLG